jgi:DNA adenine methylase
MRWAGSKRLALARLRQCFPPSYKRYIEPFAGSASLFFDLAPRDAILSDLNSELIQTYRAVKRDASLVIECLGRLRQGEDQYYRIRGLKPSGLCDAEAAARFIYLNRYCFNGLYRTNAKGKFNVPYGPPKNGAQIDTRLILEAGEALRTAMIINADFEDTISYVGPGDVVYLDPPYAVRDRRVFSEYLPGSFSGADLPRLAESLRSIDAAGGLFVISYADSAEARRLLAPWRTARIRTRRHIAGFAGHRRYAYELVATNQVTRGAS